MNLGFDGDLTAIATAAGALTKFVLYPLVQLRRRIDSDNDGVLDDDGRGAYFIGFDLQGIVVVVVLMALAFLFALLADEPLLPLMSSAATGYAVARIAHEGQTGVVKAVTR